MPQSAKPSFNPAVLQWAMTRAGITSADLREVKKYAEIDLWLSGEKIPSMGKVSDLAKKLDRPRIDFYFDEIPNIPDPPSLPDFRSHGNLDT